MAISVIRSSGFLHKPTGLALIVGTWLLVVVTGICALARHAGIPGPVIHANTLWPVGDRLPRAGGIPTLVMTLHWKCPCGPASVDELEVLMTHCRGKLSAVVLFVEPAGLPGDSSQSALWQSAVRIAGVSCVRDHNGELAARFGAQTTGQVFLYDAQGVLQFNGGITPSRAHAGDNDGRTAIEAIVGNVEPATRQTPVFGCSLR